VDEARSRPPPPSRWPHGRASQRHGRIIDGEIRPNERVAGPGRSLDADLWLRAVAVALVRRAGVREGPVLAGACFPDPAPAIGEAEPLYSVAQLVRSDAGVALGGVEMLVAEQLLDLAQVGADTQQFGGEDVPEPVRRHLLPLGDAGGAGVAEKVWVRIV
jgi:hypothetical protein